MIIGGHKFSFENTLDSAVTVPDCFVKAGSKLGSGNGEAKLYIASKTVMYPFFGHEGFRAKCFMLRSDLEAYMNALHAEYINPSQPYRGAGEMPELWKSRMREIQGLNQVVEFTVAAQDQIEGLRGYVSSRDKGYQLIR